MAKTKLTGTFEEVLSDLDNITEDDRDFLIAHKERHIKTLSDQQKLILENLKSMV